MSSNGRLKPTALRQGRSTVTRPDAAAPRAAPRPQWALGGGVPFPAQPGSAAASGRSCQSQGGLEGPWGESAGELLLGASLEEEHTQKSLSQLYALPDQSTGVQRKTNTNGARYLTDTVHRSVQATFCRVLGQRGTSLLVVLQSQPASQLLRGTSSSQTLVIINWGAGLQDALRILLH